MTRSKAIDLGLILLVLMLLFAGGSAWRSSLLARRPIAASAPHKIPQQEKPSGGTSQRLEEVTGSVAAEPKPKISRTSSSIRVRVQPGETAVMGYYEIAPGKLGASLVTPKMLEDGTVSLELKIFEAADSMELRKGAHELFPDVFDLERRGVIPGIRVNELLRFMLREKNVKTTSFPRMATASGQPVILRSGVTDSNGEFLGLSYAVQADPVPGTEGLDLSVDFHHSGIREEE